jgi:hypothetical protein
LALILAHVAVILLDILDGLELDSLAPIYTDIRGSAGANPAKCFGLPHYLTRRPSEWFAALIDPRLSA